MMSPIFDRGNGDIMIVHRFDFDIDKYIVYVSGAIKGAVVKVKI